MRLYEQICIVGLSFATMCAWAAPSATVLMKKGNVSKLLPGKHTAHEVKVGDILPEDTSVLTGERSVVRLKFSNNSTMNLGPKSKVVVSKMPQKKPNMINLLTGAIKAEVQKEGSAGQGESQNKMIIKTKSAVMGVRGTKFQATYNPQNSSTGLVTVEGEVAMKKNKDVRSSLDQVDQDLSSSTEVVEVDAGKFSGVSEKAAKPIEAVKIAPKQYDVLAKSMGSSKSASDVMKSNDVLNADKSALRPGGFVDFDTGIYVPPPENASIDKATGTYDAKEIGEVDPISGDYIPPQGVIIDAKKGIMVDEKAIESIEDTKLRDQAIKRAKLVASVRDEVNQQLDVNTVKAETDSRERSGFLPRSHSLALGARPYSEEQSFSSKGDNVNFYSESASETFFTWEQEWSDLFSTSLTLGTVNYALDKEDFKGELIMADGDDAALMDLGMIFSPSVQWKIMANVARRGYHFTYTALRQGNQVPVLQVKELTELRIGGRYLYYTKGDLDLGASLIAIWHPDDNINPIPDDGEESKAARMSGLGLRAGTDLVYRFSRHWSLNSELYLQFLDHDVVGEAKFERTNIGLGAHLTWSL